MRFLEHGMKVTGKGVRKGIRTMVIVNEMRFGLMPESGTIDAVFFLRRMQREYRANGKKEKNYFLGP